MTAMIASQGSAPKKTLCSSFNLKQISKLKLGLLAAFILAAPPSFAISHSNRIALNHVHLKLAQVESLQGQTPAGENCEVVDSDDALSILKTDEPAVSVDFLDYDMSIKKKANHLHLYAPTCDGHNEVSIEELTGEGQLVVKLLTEFRSEETQEVCILKMRR
jgi:hypothetical protein